MDFAVGWFADPIYLGHYPESMILRLGSRLPKFTEEEIRMVKGSSEVSWIVQVLTVGLMRMGSFTGAT